MKENSMIQLILLANQFLVTIISISMIIITNSLVFGIVIFMFGYLMVIVPQIVFIREVYSK